MNPRTDRAHAPPANCRADPVALLRALLEASSPSGAEAAAAEVAVAALTERGVTSGIDAAGNAVGSVGSGTGPTIMLVGHLDTVPGEIPVREHGGRMYGRGAVDAKGPLAAMISAAGAVATAGFHGRLVVAGVVGEETPESPGAEFLRAGHEPPDALVIGEPSGWSGVVLGYKGRMDVAYRVDVPATHSTNPAPSAAELCALAWEALRPVFGTREGAAFDRPTATLTHLRSDAETATAVLDVRTPPGCDPEVLLADMNDRVPAGEFRLRHAVPAVRAGRADPVVRALTASVRRHGSEPRLKVKTATSDMNTLGRTWRVPMAAYGPGDSHLDHGPDEHLVMAEYLRSIDVLTEAIHGLAAELAAQHRP
ncbi:acetylornithine deacetylase [Nocardiopsis sp. Huas11]|uniref:M20/M25/M40 family metallo-hydrolase n=1 Tax=Nocardiopsis sp. Huas11 TaxID=2183912 RepID=UPI000EB58F81|nr:M20/M25/M40 family metallo-hydrolase [Nocardiopsis sp. Huas11]RKS08408.1 acetylornithine deacetylase [Nocardiopsis sp. Huas11]